MAEQQGREDLSAVHATVRPDWLAKTVEPVLEPDLPIVDPHHHLWDAQRQGRYMFPDLLDDLNTGHDVRMTVFMECRVMYKADGDPACHSLGETEFVNGVAAMSASGAYGPARACAGIVGNVDLRIGERSAEVLQAHIQARGGRFRGIRRGSAHDPHPDVKGTTANPPPGLLGLPAFREGFRTLAPLGLSFDAWLLHPQIGELEDLARAFPETTIVMDHVGGPIGVGPYRGRRDEIFEDWCKSVRAIAQCPNVHVKLGGLPMRVIGFDYHDREVPPGSKDLARDWKPYVDTCIEAFGTKRAMFESNFPVDKGGCSYPVLWNAFKRLATGCSADEKADLFHRTACRVYRLPAVA